MATIHNFKRTHWELGTGSQDLMGQCPVGKNGPK